MCNMTEGRAEIGRTGLVYIVCLCGGAGGRRGAQEVQRWFHHKPRVWDMGHGQQLDCKAELQSRNRRIETIAILNMTKAPRLKQKCLLYHRNAALQLDSLTMRWTTIHQSMSLTRVAAVTLNTKSHWKRSTAIWASTLPLIDPPPATNSGTQRNQRAEGNHRTLHGLESP